MIPKGEHVNGDEISMESADSNGSCLKLIEFELQVRIFIFLVLVSFEITERTACPLRTVRVRESMKPKRRCQQYFYSVLSYGYLWTGVDFWAFYFKMFKFENLVENPGQGGVKFIAITIYHRNLSYIIYISI